MNITNNQQELIQTVYEREGGHRYIPSYDSDSQAIILAAWLDDSVNYDTVSVLAGGLNPFDMPTEDILIDHWESIENWLEHAHTKMGLS